MARIALTFAGSLVLLWLGLRAGSALLAWPPLDWPSCALIIVLAWLVNAGADLAFRRNESERWP